jgi:hypothetical protein
MGARVYNPYTGTFTQPDPVQGGGANAYGYTDGDPVNETDLSGESVVFNECEQDGNCTDDHGSPEPKSPTLGDLVQVIAFATLPTALLDPLEGGAEDGASTLFRFGTEPESAERLGQQSAQAESNGLPHGVSVFSRSNRADAVSASRSDIEEHFNVVKTGKSPYHYTVELPNPVTQEHADTFNRLFGRVK